MTKELADKNYDFSVAFDIESLLVRSKGKLIPRYSTINLFKALDMLGTEMYIWSEDGVPYAKQWKDKLGLKSKVVAKGSFEPDISVNIENEDLGKINLDANGKNEKIKIGSDVDGTLIYNGKEDAKDDKGHNLEDTPRYPVINLYNALEMLGADMYIWSSHGKKYAKKMKKKLGLNGTPMDKDPSFGMDINIDNADFSLSLVTIKV